MGIFWRVQVDDRQWVESSRRVHAALLGALSERQLGHQRPGDEEMGIPLLHSKPLTQWALVFLSVWIIA